MPGWPVTISAIFPALLANMAHSSASLNSDRTKIRVLSSPQILGITPEGFITKRGGSGSGMPMSSTGLSPLGESSGPVWTAVRPFPQTDSLILLQSGRSGEGAEGFCEVVRELLDCLLLGSDVFLEILEGHDCRMDEADEPLQYCVTL